MRIHQVWIIMNNGVCPIHLLYQGQQLEENLFAAFVRALFSFSKDMSSGEKSISSMSFGDMEIHYLAHPEEKFFVAIAADAGIDVEGPNHYLKYISEIFSSNYPDYIEKLPPFEPYSFAYFKHSIDEFIRFHEKNYENSLEGIEGFDLDQIDLMQSSKDFVLFFIKNSCYLKLFNKRDLDFIGSYYPEKGNIKSYSLQKDGNFVTYLSDNNTIQIQPIPVIDSSDIPNRKMNIEEDIFWLFSHPVKNQIYYGSTTQIYQYNVESEEIFKTDSEVEIKKVLIHESDKILIIDKDNKLYEGSLPLTSDLLVLREVLLEQEIFSINYGPKDLLILKCIDKSIYFWNCDDKKILLKENLSTESKISFSEENDLIFIISEYNEFFIFEMDGSQLVNYNLTSKAIGAFVSEKNLNLIYINGSIKPFPATINRVEIFQLRQYLTKRVDSVENHILRIHKGFQTIVQNLEKKRASSTINHDLNQIKVYNQQIKKLIDTKLLERTSILKDIYFRLLGYENQVNRLINLIKELEGELEYALKASKENELSGKSSKERVDDYIKQMKPRQTIGIGTLAESLQLPYEEVLGYIKSMEQNGLLTGFLTRGSGVSIKDSVVFVKKDPRFEESGITSF